MNLELALQHRAQVEQFRRKHRTGLVTLLFTDLVGSTQLKTVLGDQEGVALIQSHHVLVRDILGQFQEAEEISTAGDSFFIVFVKPSDAVRFALLLQARLRALAIASQDSSPEGPPLGGGPSPRTLRERIGIHIGEVVIEEREGAARKDLYGMQVDIAARVMGLAQANQILLTRSAFDNARQVLKGEDIPGLLELSWLSHGPYVVFGLEEPLEICEVGEADSAHLKPPADAAKARRRISPDEEPILGWRPAVGTVVPNSQWKLEQKLGEGGFGEVWLGRHLVMKEPRVFKFCFRADRVRSLKREMTLFRLIKERIGDHPNIVSLREVYFDQPPYYVEEDYVEGRDLATWCKAQGGADNLPLETKLEVVAQVAEALQAAHDAGVIHRDVKPGNILVSDRKPKVQNSGSASTPPQPSALEGYPLAKLTDFGIGQVISQEYLAGVTKAGFTETMMSPTSGSQTGTHLYMAPELLTGKPASTRSDIYSLGLVLYQCLVGDFGRPVTTDWAADITEPLLKEDLQQCFAGNPANRFAAASLLAGNLRSLPRRRAERTAQKEAERYAARRRLLTRTSVSVVFGLILLATALGYGLKRAREETLRARQIAYASDMNVAWQALKENNLDLVSRLLNAQVPERGQQDLRHWEWRYLWQESRGQQLWTLEPPGEVVLGLAVLPEDRLAIGAGGPGPGGRVYLWDLKRQQIIRASRFRANVSSLAATPDGRRLAVAAWTQVVTLLDARTLEIVGEIHHSKPVWMVAFSPDGKLLSVQGSEDVSVWDVASLRRVWKVNAFRSLCEAPFLPDGQSLVVCDFHDNTAAQLRTSDGSLLWTNDSRIGISCVTSASNGQLVAWGTWTGQLGLQDLLAGQTRWLTNHMGAVRAMAFSPGGGELTFACDGGLVQRWNLKTGTEAAPLSGHRKTVVKILYSSDGRRLFTASEDGTVRGWDTTQQSVNAPARLSTAPLLQPDLGEFGSRPISRQARFFAQPDTNGIRHIIDLRTLREIGQSRLPSDWRTFALSPDGRYAAAGGPDGKVIVWDVAANNLAWSLGAHSNIVDVVEFSRDGERLATAARGGEIRVWKRGESHPQLTRLFGGPGSRVHDLVFTPDGRILLAPVAGKIHLLSLVNGLSDRAIPYDGEVYCINVSEDGSLIAAGLKGQVSVWELSSLRLVATLVGSQGNFTCTVSFSPDGRRVVAADSVRLVWLWDLATGREVGRFEPSFPVNAQSAQFQAGGDTIVRGEDNGLELLRAPAWNEIKEAEKADAKARLNWPDE